MKTENSSLMENVEWKMENVEWKMEDVECRPKEDPTFCGKKCLMLKEDKSCFI